MKGVNLEKVIIQVTLYTNDNSSVLCLSPVLGETLGVTVTMGSIWLWGQWGPRTAWVQPRPWHSCPTAGTAPGQPGQAQRGAQSHSITVNTPEDCALHRKLPLQRVNVFWRRNFNILVKLVASCWLVGGLFWFFLRLLNQIFQTNARGNNLPLSDSFLISCNSHPPFQLCLQTPLSPLSILAPLSCSGILRSTI